MVNLFSFGCHVIDRAYASTDCTGEVGETITKEGRDVSGVSREIHIFFIGRGGGGYSHTLPIWVCAFQRGRDFEAPDLERGIHLKLFKDRLLLTIRFSELTSKLLYSCCTLCFSLQGERILASSDSAILDK